MREGGNVMDPRCNWGGGCRAGKGGWVPGSGAGDPLHRRTAVTSHGISRELRGATECSPKSRNCFMDSGDGENLEKRSTCFGIPRTEPFFHRNWPNFIFCPPHPPSNCYRGSRLSPTRPGAWNAKAKANPGRISPAASL